MKIKNILKNKKIIIATLSILLVGSMLILFSNNDKLLKLKTSVIDPETGDTCNFSNDEGYDEDRNTDINSSLDEIIHRSKSTCEGGYKCEGKPIIASTPDELSCWTASAEDINVEDEGYDSQFSGSLEYYVEGLVPNNTFEDVLKNLYTIYNSDYYCPQSYCVPRTYEITLDPNGGTGGTTKIYEVYDQGLYLDEEATRSLSSYPITPPTKSYTVTYDDNGTGATFSNNTQSVNVPFGGYFLTATTNDNYLGENDYTECSTFYNSNMSEKEYNGDFNNEYYNAFISSSGYETSSFNYDQFPQYFECKGDKLTARYALAELELPSITKQDYTCYWELNSSSSDYTPYEADSDYDYPTGEGEYAAGTDVTIGGDTTFYAVCYHNPTLTVRNYTCNENGENCSKKSETTYTKSYGTIEVYSPNSYSGYSAPSNKTVTFNDDQELDFYHTKNKSYSNFGQGSNNSNYVITQNSGDTAMTISARSGVSNANYVAIYSSAAAGSDYKWRVGAGQTDNFTFSHFTSSGNKSGDGVGYGAPSNGKYGVYIASFISNYNDTDSWRDVLNGEAGSAQIRPHIRLIHMNGNSTFGNTQTKTLRNTVATYASPTKTGYTFKAWQAFGKTSNSTGVDNAALTACTQNNANVYYPANYTINATSWNLNNASYPCPSMWGYVDNIMTVYLYPVWQKNAWSELY